MFIYLHTTASGVRIGGILHPGNVHWHNTGYKEKPVNTIPWSFIPLRRPNGSDWVFQRVNLVLKKESWYITLPEKVWHLYTKIEVGIIRKSQLFNVSFRYIFIRGQESALWSQYQNPAVAGIGLFIKSRSRSKSKFYQDFTRILDKMHIKILEKFAAWWENVFI